MACRILGIQTAIVAVIIVSANTIFIIRNIPKLGLGW